MHEEAWKTRSLKLTSSEVNPVRWVLTRGISFRLRSVPGVMSLYVITHYYKKKHTPQVRCKMIQFARLQATNGNTRNGKRTNLEELPRPHKLPQSAPVKSVEGGVKINKTCLPPIGLPCLSKVLKEDQPPQRHRLATIDKEVSPQQVKQESPSHMDTLFCGPLWEKHVIRHQVEVADGLSGVFPP